MSLNITNQYSKKALKVRDKIHFIKYNNSKVVLNNFIFQITEPLKLKKIYIISVKDLPIEFINILSFSNAH